MARDCRDLRDCASGLGKHRDDGRAPKVVEVKALDTAGAVAAAAAGTEAPTKTAVIPRMNDRRKVGILDAGVLVDFVAIATSIQGWWWLGPKDSVSFPSARFSCTQKSMKRQEKTVHKKSRGRPAGRNFVETIPVRLTIELAEDVGAWAQTTGVSRSEAIRRLVELGLKTKRR